MLNDIRAHIYEKKENALCCVQRDVIDLWACKTKASIRVANLIRLWSNSMTLGFGMGFRWKRRNVVNARATPCGRNLSHFDWEIHSMCGTRLVVRMNRTVYAGYVPIEWMHPLFCSIEIHFAKCCARQVCVFELVSKCVEHQTVVWYGQNRLEFRNQCDSTSATERSLSVVCWCDSHIQWVSKSKLKHQCD